jgi:CheY-like chemotaxis protein
VGTRTKEKTGPMPKSVSVLLVEDNRLYQLLFIQVLKEIKHAILYDVVSNGREALDKLEHSDTLPDFIFTDINMPVMDGLECLTLIKKNPKIKDIPVVVLSASTPQPELVKKLGAKVFLKKSSDSNTLREQLEELITADATDDNHMAS